MTAPHIVDPARVLGNLLTDASPDMMRQLLQTIINALLSADADQVVGAQWGQPSPERVSQRNGYRHRPLDTRAGTIDVAVPKLRSGTYFPEWLLERRECVRRRAPTMRWRPFASAGPKYYLTTFVTVPEPTVRPRSHASEVWRYREVSRLLRLLLLANAREAALTTT